VPNLTQILSHHHHLIEVLEISLKLLLWVEERKLSKEKAKGKLSARERIEYLLDKKANQIEIGALSALDMYEEHGGCPSAGVIVVIGYIKR